MADGDDAKQMMEGEFESQQALYDYVPSFIPKPIAWGTFKDKNTHFFLSDFVEMTDSIPTPAKFCAKLAELHGKSMEKSSPGTKFGFQMNTTQGNILLNNEWCDTWEMFFSRAMDHMINREQVTQGPCPEIDELRKPLLEKVIPRLLRPLESNERSIRPCLVHGDLWHGNTLVSSKTGDPYAFDSCVLWAHNECRN
jgi:protein-ribulosamine 3-kinase